VKYNKQEKTKKKDKKSNEQVFMAQLN